MPGLISRALRVRPENTEISTSPQLADAIRSRDGTWAGMSMSVDRALTYSAFFDGVRIIAEDVAKLPFPVYRTLPNGSRERAVETREYTLLHDEPNDFQSSQMFREFMTACALLRGGGYALKNVIRGEVRELLPLDPRGVVPELTEDFRLLFHVRYARGDIRVHTLSEVFYLPGFTLNGYTGVSILTYARQSLALALAQERHAATYFGNGAHPKGGFKTPKQLSDAAHQRLSQELADLQREDAHNALLLEDGLDWVEIGVNNQDSQFLESRGHSIEDVARWLRLPPHKLAKLDRATFNNIEHLNIEYVTDTLFAWGERWKYAARRGLQLQAKRLFAELLFEALLKGDTKTQAEAYRISVGAPYRTRAEVRRELNLPDLGDPALEQVITPKNVDAGDPGAPGAPAPERTEDDRAG